MVILFPMHHFVTYTKGVVSLEGDSVLILQYLSASEIWTGWPLYGGALLEGWSLLRGEI
jgi:hypothetical protein